MAWATATPSSNDGVICVPVRTASTTSPRNDDSAGGGDRRGGRRKFERLRILAWPVHDQCRVCRQFDRAGAADQRRARRERNRRGEAGVVCGGAAVGHQEPRRVRVLGRRLGRRPVDPGDAAAFGDLAAEQPPGEVDQMRSVGADPPAAELTVVDPAVLAATQSAAVERPVQMHWCADGSSVGQLLDLRPRLVEAELEVQEVQHAGVTGAFAHRLGFRRVAPERFVAQHRVSVLDRGAHMIDVHEGRRVHGDQVDVRRHGTLHRDVVARADHLDIESETLIDRGGGMLAEAGPDDRNLHANSPVRPVPPTRRVSSSRVADRPSGSRRSGWL